MKKKAVSRRKQPNPVELAEEKSLLTQFLLECVTLTGTDHPVPIQLIFDHYQDYKESRGVEGLGLSVDSFGRLLSKSFPRVNRRDSSGKMLKCTLGVQLR